MGLNGRTALGKVSNSMTKGDCITSELVLTEYPTPHSDKTLSDLSQNQLQPGLLLHPCASNQPEI